MFQFIHLKKNFLRQFCFLTFVLLLSSCDSNQVFTGGPTNPSVNSPDNDVAVNVLPVQSTVVVDTLAKANEIRNNIEFFVDELSGVESSGGQKLTTPLVVDDDFDDVTTTLDFAQSIACDTAGTKNIIGSATLTYNREQSSGTIVGSFTQQYSNCQELALLTASNGNCSASATLVGEVTSTISIDFNLSAQDLAGETVIDFADVDTTTTSPLDISVGSKSSTQTYNYSMDLSTNNSSTNLIGTVSYQNFLYLLSDVETFGASTSTTSLCP